MQDVSYIRKLTSTSGVTRSATNRQYFVPSPNNQGTVPNFQIPPIHIGIPVTNNFQKSIATKFTKYSDLAIKIR